MKKVTLFLPSMANGGAERVMLNIAQGLARQSDIDVDLLLVSATGPYMDQIGDGIRVVDLNASRIITSLPSVIRYLRKEKPTSVLSALDTTNLVMIWAKLLGRSQSRVVVSVHCNFTSALEGAKNYRAKFLPMLVGYFYKKADAIVAVSKGVATDLEQSTGIRRDTVDVLVNPVITNDLKIKQKAQPRHPWFADIGSDIILGIGRLTHQKNFHLLLYSFADVLKEREAKLLILGSGDQEAELKELCKKLLITEHVDFAGFVENPYAYLSHARLFVLSSRYEGLPTVLIEALHCGIEVISTNCPSGPEEILEGGELGTLVPVENQTELSRAMVNSLAKTKKVVPAEKLSQYHHEVVVQNYRDLLLKDT